jgi:hypothetical protein
MLVWLILDYQVMIWEWLRIQACLMLSSKTKALLRLKIAGHHLVLMPDLHLRLALMTV